MTRNFVVLVLFAFVSLIVSCTSMTERIHNHCIEGEVIKKKFDRHQHGTLDVKFTNSCDSSFTWFFVEGVDEKFWNYLSIGDSLFKEKDTLLIRVKKPLETKWFRLSKW